MNFGIKIKKNMSSPEKIITQIEKIQNLNFSSLGSDDDSESINSVA